jgi:RHS repeat-associated protein
MKRSGAMTGQRETLLCRYSYDPLDRVVGCAPLNQDSVQRYYRKNRLVTEIQGPVEYSVMEHDQQLLAQQQHQAGRVDSTLLATDLQRSVLHSVSVGQHQKPVYSPYGHRSPASGLLSLLGFNGERREPVTGHHLLGNGYRAFNSVLMRFNSPDSLSPFGKGGVNAYAYCFGDPVNLVDPRGEFGMLAHMINQLGSASVAAVQQVVKGLAAFKKTAVRSLFKAPARPGHGPLSNLESGRNELVSVMPKRRSALISEANVKAGELDLYEVGARYRRAAKADIQQKRALKSQHFVEGNELPDEMKYKFPADYNESHATLPQDENNLIVVARAHVLQSPGEFMPTQALVKLIRSV